MPDLYVHTSNRLEILAQHLADIVKHTGAPVLTPEIVVVQSRGMQRWVSMDLARQTGICANLIFPLPNVFIQDLLERFVPESALTPPPDPDILTFSIMRWLPALMDEKGFEGIRSYVAGGRSGLKLFQISRHIGDLFDQYAIFRPDMMLSWETGHADHWQARLWRQILQQGGSLHRARLQQTLIENLMARAERPAANPWGLPDSGDPGTGPAPLPHRISLFGISYLPPLYLQTFAALSRLIEVHFFILNPCREYWGDIVSEREGHRISRKAGTSRRAPKDLHLEKGNRLLASMGVLGRHFLKLIDDFEHHRRETFVDPPKRTLLSKIQSDILNLKDRDVYPPDGFETEGDDPDDSVQIHSCHSPMREIEVLHNALLAMFETHADLLPNDVVVMAPDIESYAPFIHAVFDAPTDDVLRIPYSIADRSARSESRIIDGFMSLLEFRNSRFSASDVLKLLEFDEVRKRFGLSEDDMPLVEKWIRDTRICWGIDAKDRIDRGLPGFSENTWQAGMDRLLLGYAMPGNDERLFANILPYDDIEGSDTRILGNFLNFLHALFDAVGQFKQPKPLSGWHEVLLGILDRFFGTGEGGESDTQAVRAALYDLKHHQEASGFDEKVACDIIDAFLTDRLRRTHAGSGFIAGGVTFCAALPMRSIPFQIICFIGLDHDAFPRESRSLSFDLIAKNPRVGDRSRRTDDRYLFLEALMSARDTLYLSYVGQNIQDNTTRPPSVLVSELTDYIQDGFGLSKDRLTTRHRLQAFSPAYFRQENGLYSYSKEDLAAARRLFLDTEMPPFFSKKLFPSAGEMQTKQSLDLDMLCAFFVHPTRFLLQKRLGLYIETHDTAFMETERFGLNALERYVMADGWMKRRRVKGEDESFLSIERSAGRLPHGHVGEVLARDLYADVDAFFEKVDRFTSGGPLQPVEIHLPLAGWTLTGRLSNLYAPGLVRVHYARKKAKYLLQAWIQHLALCGSGHEHCTILVCRDSMWEFRPLKEARTILAELVSLYRDGWVEPLRFFPESSYEFARRVIVQSKSEQQAMKAATQKWEGSDFSLGESDDPYHARCFQQTDPLDPVFRKLAITVFSPVFAHGGEAIVPLTTTVRAGGEP